MRSPRRQSHEWRFHAFIDAGVLTLNDPLPEQEDRFELASVGVGTRFQLWNHFNGSLDAGFPLIDQGRTEEGDWRLTFRLWTEFLALTRSDFTVFRFPLMVLVRPILAGLRTIIVLAALPALLAAASPAHRRGR